MKPLETNSFVWYRDPETRRMLFALIVILLAISAIVRYPNVSPWIALTTVGVYLIVSIVNLLLRILSFSVY